VVWLRIVVSCWKSPLNSIFVFFPVFFRRSQVVFFYKNLFCHGSWKITAETDKILRLLQLIFERSLTVASVRLILFSSSESDFWTVLLHLIFGNISERKQLLQTRLTWSSLFDFRQSFKLDLHRCCWACCGKKILTAFQCFGFKETRAFYAIWRHLASPVHSPLHLIVIPCVDRFPNVFISENHRYRC